MLVLFIVAGNYRPSTTAIVTRGVTVGTDSTIKQDYSSIIY